MENYWRGFIASAEYGWSPNGRTLEEYDKAWLQREFALSVPDFLSFNEQLRRGSVFWYEAFFKKGSLLDEDNALQSFSRLEHWLPPLADQEKVQFDYTTKLIELPDLNSPGTWTRKYNDRMEKARVETDNYIAQSQRLQELYNASKRNRYYWELSMALYDLQITAPRLLLALQQCDNADKGQQKAGIEQVKLAVQGFQLAWENLKQVYGKTRFVAYPANYVPDRYFHFASQREDLSWMIQAEEMYLGMIEKWIQKK
jgi:hypothetical protein